MIKLSSLLDGEVSEWFKELVLKTSDSQEPWVRIPPSPPKNLLKRQRKRNEFSTAVSKSEYKRNPLTNLEKYSSW